MWVRRETLHNDVGQDHTQNIIVYTPVHCSAHFGFQFATKKSCDLFERHIKNKSITFAMMCDVLEMSIYENSCSLSLRSNLQACPIVQLFFQLSLHADYELAALIKFHKKWQLTCSISRFIIIFPQLLFPLLQSQMIIDDFSGINWQSPFKAMKNYRMEPRRIVSLERSTFCMMLWCRCWWLVNNLNLNHDVSDVFSSRVGRRLLVPKLKTL